MTDVFEFPGQPQENKARQMALDYLKQANNARDAQDGPLALHLYLAAFEKAAAAEAVPSEDAIQGMKEAWKLAYQQKERSLAEYIFEKLEPYLTHEEVQECAAQLQDLSLDKLAEFGFNRDQLQGMAELIQQEMSQLPSLPGMGPMTIGPISISGPIELPADASSILPPEATTNALPIPQVNDTNQNEGKILVKEPADGGKLEMVFPEAPLTYKDLHGYTSAIKDARALGIGREADEQYKKLMEQLNAYHGLSHTPSPDSIIISAYAREDAIKFMEATVGELGLTGIHMRVEDSFQGAPVLCVSADKRSKLKYNNRTQSFTGKGVLILEDLDLWDLPPMEQQEGINGFILSQLSKGAREAISLIHAAVVDPNVYVMATVSTEEEINPFFMDLIEPFKRIDIALPTPGERADIWLDITHRHASLRLIDRAQLVRLSNNMPRFDMYCAARDAVEETYKSSMQTETFKPVPASVLFEKIAAFQPLESDEYKALEEAIIQDMWVGVDSVDELIGDK